MLLADLLRLGSLPESWVAPPGLRELRELVRYRHKLVNMRSSLKAQAHAVMAKEGVLPAMTDMFGPGGQDLLDEMDLAGAYRIRMESLRELMSAFNTEIAALEREVHDVLKDHAGYNAVQAIDGVGRVFGSIFVAEIGDVHRFPGPAQLCSWAGLTPKHHESDTTVHRVDHQAGIPACALGGHRGRRQAPRRPQTPGRLPPHRGPPRGIQGPGSGGPQTSHPRLLRPTRRRDPLPGRDGMSNPGRSRLRAR